MPLMPEPEIKAVFIFDDPERNFNLVFIDDVTYKHALGDIQRVLNAGGLVVAFNTGNGAVLVSLEGLRRVVTQECAVRVSTGSTTGVVLPGEGDHD